MSKQLAKISNATLEIKERGVLNFWIYVDYEEGGSQGVGGFVLDSYDKIKERRVGSAFGCEMIRRLLLELNVNDFSEMKGRNIWVLGEGEGFGFKPTGIKALKGDGGSDDGVVFKSIIIDMGVNCEQ